VGLEPPGDLDGFTVLDLGLFFYFIATEKQESTAWEMVENPPSPGPA